MAPGKNPYSASLPEGLSLPTSWQRLEGQLGQEANSDELTDYLLVIPAKAGIQTTSAIITVLLTGFSADQGAASADSGTVPTKARDPDPVGTLATKSEPTMSGPPLGRRPLFHHAPTN